MKTLKILFALAIVGLTLNAIVATLALTLGLMTPASHRAPAKTAPAGHRATWTCQLPTADAGYSEDAGDMPAGAVSIPCVNGGYVSVAQAHMLADGGNFAAPCIMADSAVPCATTCVGWTNGAYYPAPCAWGNTWRIIPDARGHNWTPASQTGYYAQYFALDGALVSAEYTSTLDM